MSYHRRYIKRNANRFGNYREITVEFDFTADCGHAIKKGDRIGWHPKHGTQCPNCWTRCVAEAIKAGYLPTWL